MISSGYNCYLQLKPKKDTQCNLEVSVLVNNNTTDSTKPTDTTNLQKHIRSSYGHRVLSKALQEMFSRLVSVSLDNLALSQSAFFDSHVYLELGVLKI